MTQLLCRFVDGWQRVERAFLLCMLGVLASFPANSAVGRTEGRFDVSSAGAATYAIPLWAPPGVRGVQPNVALVYSSSGGGGPIGKGWAVSGLSSINRCLRTYAQDSNPQAVTLTLDDGFCLDGSRLRLTGGVYGTAGSTYETEIATFAQVIAQGAAGNGPAWFQVRGKDGLYYEYGNGSNSQVLATGSSTASSWMLSRIADRNGNTLLTVSYAAPGTDLQGATVPVTISWAPTSAGAATFQNAVQFQYVSNVPQGSIFGYVAGTAVQNSLLLSDLTVSGAGSVVRKYVLTYDTSPTTGVKRLTQVKECADAVESNCFAPTVIGYQDAQPGVSGTPVSVTGLHFSTGKYDFNGDGFNDLSYFDGGVWYVRWGSTGGYSSPVNTGVTLSTGQTAFGDLRGEGKVGLVTRNGADWWYYSWNGSGFSGVSTGVAFTSVLHDMMLTDVSGDGLPDLAVGRNHQAPFGGSYSYILDIWRNTSSGGGISFTSGGGGLFGSGSVGPFVGPAQLSGPGEDLPMFDFNGDGRGDLILLTAEDDCQNCQNPYSIKNQLISQANGTFTLQPLFQDTSSPPHRLINWNSDACTDMVVQGIGILVAACNGAPAQTIAMGEPLLGVMDWDADGLLDAIIANGSTLGVRLSTGNGIGSVISTSIPSATTSCLVRILDYNGDGLDDLGCGHSTAPVVYPHNAVATQPDLATSFTDGFGRSFNPAYLPLNHTTYTQDSATFPNVSYHGSAYVVDHFTATDDSGTAAMYTVNLSYSGAWQNLQGRGFLGFSSVRRIDSRNGIHRRDEYQRAFPYTGMLKQRDLFQADGTTLIQTVAYNATAHTLSSAANNERYFPYIDATYSTTYEVGGAKNGQEITYENMTLSYDWYGNATVVTRMVQDMDSGSPHHLQFWNSTTTTSFLPDTGNWCLNQPTQVQEVRTAPGVSNVARNVTYSVHYPLCRPTQQIVEAGSATYEVTTALDYDSFGNVDGETVTGIGLAARATAIDWGTTGQLPIAVTNPLAQTTQFGYDYRYGVLTSTTTPNSGNNTTGWVPDAFGRIVQENRPDGTYTVATATMASGGLDPRATYAVSYAEYASGGAPVRTDYSVHDHLGRSINEFRTPLAGGGYVTTTRGFDALGRPSWEGSPFIGSGGTQYTPAHTTTYDYDVLDRMIEVSSPTSESNPAAITTGIAHAGRTRTVTDALGKHTAAITTVTGTLARTTDHNGYYQQLTHDPYGNVVSVVDSLGNTLFAASYQYGIEAFQTSTADMDLGARTNVYNALGELTSTTDAKSQTATMTWDPLSRPLQRIEPGLVTDWTWGNTPGSYNVGQLESVSAGGYGEVYAYDSVSRLASKQITIPSDQAYVLSYTYNSQGALDLLTFPASTGGTQVMLKYGYGAGLLTSVTDWTGGAAGTTYWQATGVGPWGQVGTEALGNGVIRTRLIDAVTGRATHLRAGLGGGTSLQNMSFLYDAVGNVTQRQETNLGLTEDFHYDDLHRLQYSQLGGVTNRVLGYDPSGNIQTNYDPRSQSSVTWTYDTVKKHAVKTDGVGHSYDYDANGNMITRSSGGAPNRTIGWTSYDYPHSISDGSESTTFAYGPDRRYYEQVYIGPGGTETTRYIDEVLEKVTIGADTDWRHYVKAGGQTVAIVSRLSTGANTVHYVLEDHIGSPAILANSSGSAVVRESFEAFGEGRDAASWSGLVPSGDQAAIAAISRRGYTGHAMLGQMGLVHMNGRMMDAKLGRFLSADRYVPNPALTQAYNRYSYVRNNPLRFTDPDGFWPRDLLELYDEQDEEEEELEEVIVRSRRSTDAGFWERRALPVGLEELEHVLVSGVRPKKKPQSQKDVCSNAPALPPGESYSGNIAMSHALVDLARTNSVPTSALASSLAQAPMRLVYFYDQVRNSGPWDYKQQGTQYQAAGNFNYGVTGAAMGIPDQILLRGAGWAQQRAGTSASEFGSPYWRAPYGDDPQDQQLIKQGIQYYNMCGRS